MKEQLAPAPHFLKAVSEIVVVTCLVLAIKLASSEPFSYVRTGAEVKQ